MAEPTGIPPLDCANSYNERLEVARTKIQEALNTPGFFPGNPPIVVTLNVPNADLVQAWIETPVTTLTYDGSYAFISGILRIKMPFSMVSAGQSVGILCYHALGYAGTTLSVAEGGDNDPFVIMYGENNDSITISTGFKEN